MKQIEAKIFFSPDLYLSAALVLLLNSQPAFKLVNGKVLFGFPITDALYRAMAEYNCGSPLNALEFSQSIKRLKSEMLMRRSMGNAEVNNAIH
jgi:hypothetical protein